VQRFFAIIPGECPAPFLRTTNWLANHLLMTIMTIMTILTN
jgi:hypothetical protein